MQETIAEHMTSSSTVTASKSSQWQWHMAVETSGLGFSSLIILLLLIWAIWVALLVTVARLFLVLWYPNFLKIETNVKILKIFEQ